MNRVKYGEIWEVVINPTIDVILKNPNIQIVYNLNILKEKIYEEYEKTKAIVHTYMSDVSGKIDRHKIASCFILAIRNIRPFEFSSKSVNEKMSVKLYLVNEILALKTALSIVYSFVMSDEIKSVRDKFKNGFPFPRSQHDDYFNYLIQDLYYSFQVNKCFDLFTFSNLLFMIEEYTKK